MNPELRLRGPAQREIGRATSPLTKTAIRLRRLGRRTRLAAACVAAAVLASAVVPAASPASATPVPPSTTAGPGCALGAKLVPTCGVLWGMAPAAYSSADRLRSTLTAEQLQGRPLDIYHGYHVNNQSFPNATERAIALDPAHPRLLLINWKPATDMTWARVAAGAADARVDAAARSFTSFPDRFFLAIWHEPEHSVKPAAGSGMTANDYKAMVRHVVMRLRADGATTPVFVQIFQGYPAYAVQPWWPQMYPGDDVIDWIASDSYNSGRSTGYNSGDFSALVNRSKDSWHGWYSWATANHPTKPLMLGEWGVWTNRSEPTRQAWFYREVQQKLPLYPRIKAMVYFNTAHAASGATSIDSSSANLAAYRSLSASVPRVSLSNR